jgi:glycosyltransferase involved in cell wall biosynthesis
VSLSSVCLEALIQGKPVISVNMRDCRDISGLVQDGLAIGAYNEDELKDAVRKCIENPESCVAPEGRREELLLPFTGPLDRQSSRRVAELLEPMANRIER